MLFSSWYYLLILKVGGPQMSLFEEYMSQASSSGSTHYDEHSDKWVDEASESIYGHSGYCDVHSDEKY